MTAMTWAAVALAVAGGIVYHVAAKSVPKERPPALVLVVAYATALLISGAAYATSLSEAAAPGGRMLHPGVLGLGVGAAMIEIGYVLMYRAAWPVSAASLVVNGAVAAVLVMVGVAAFGERMSAGRIAGVLLCLAGVWLLRR
jgi:drug/metabolite transporter (DMT)-like permease